MADGRAVLFTASWGEPSPLVHRSDGAYRRKYLVHLHVPAEHRELPFHQVRSVRLFLTGDRPPLETDDLQGVTDRDLGGVTLAMYIEDRH